MAMLVITRGYIYIYIYFPQTKLLSPDILQDMKQETQCRHFI